MSNKDRAIIARWLPRLVQRIGLEKAAKRRHAQAQASLRRARALDAHPRQEFLDARDEASRDLSTRRRQVAEARRIIARHRKAGGGVAAPVWPIEGDSWGFHRGVHDGTDVLASYGDDVVAMVDAIVVDARASGWWGNAARPTSGHPVSDGDGIIQLQVTRDLGPFRKGDIIGYGHAEHADVVVGQRVRAGQNIGSIGWAVVGHIHLMHQRGLRWVGRPQGVGTRDSRAILDYAVRNGTKR